MRPVRIHIDVPLQPGTSVTLPPAAARHVARVLRLKAGDPITLFNGDDRQYPGRVSMAGPHGVRVRTEAVESPIRESTLEITLLQALARGEKMDWIVQKATELGVTRIAPVVCDRGGVKLDASRGAKRRDHWQAIAIAACEQCGRNVIPGIDPPAMLVAWLAANRAPAAAPQRWLLCPGAAQRVSGLRVAATTRADLAIGPEGGFGEGDRAALHAHRFRDVSLGPRILRTETAGIAALAALLALHGDL